MAALADRPAEVAQVGGARQPGDGEMLDQIAHPFLGVRHQIAQGQTAKRPIGNHASLLPVPVR